MVEKKYPRNRTIIYAVMLLFLTLGASSFVMAVGSSIISALPTSKFVHQVSPTCKIYVINSSNETVLNDTFLESDAVISTQFNMYYGLGINEGFMDDIHDVSSQEGGLKNFSRIKNDLKELGYTNQTSQIFVAIYPTVIVLPSDMGILIQNFLSEDFLLGIPSLGLTIGEFGNTLFQTYTLELHESFMIQNFLIGLNMSFTGLDLNSYSIDGFYAVPTTFSSSHFEEPVTKHQDFAGVPFIEESIVPSNSERIWTLKEIVIEQHSPYNYWIKKMLYDVSGVEIVLL